MATTSGEIKPEPVAIEWHQGKVQDLTELITSHSPIVIESSFVISETNVEEVGWQAQSDDVAPTLGREMAPATSENAMGFCLTKVSNGVDSDE